MIVIDRKGWGEKINGLPEIGAGVAVPNGILNFFVGNSLPPQEAAYVLLGSMTL